MEKHNIKYNEYKVGDMTNKKAVLQHGEPRECDAAVNFVTSNRTCVCDFLLVRHSNLDPFLHRFRDHIAGICAHDSTTSSPVGPDPRCWGQPEPKP